VVQKFIPYSALLIFFKWLGLHITMFLTFLIFTLFRYQGITRILVQVMSPTRAYRVPKFRV